MINVMNISKELKNATFDYNELSKSFTISDKNGNTVELNKVYAFAFMRFVVRMAQRNWLRSKKIVDKDPESMIESDAIDHPDQLIIF
jgi:hypothetical protein